MPNPDSVIFGWTRDLIVKNRAHFLIYNALTVTITQHTHVHTNTKKNIFLKTAHTRCLKFKKIP